MSGDRPEAMRSPPLQFGLRLLFVVVAVCAISLALYGRFGAAAILALLVAATILVTAAVWIIDSCRAIHEMFWSSPRTRPSYHLNSVIETNDRVRMLEQLVGQLTTSEQCAQDLYVKRAGPLEDVLRARGVRLKAEIDLLREKARRRRHW